MSRPARSASDMMCRARRRTTSGSSSSTSVSASTPRAPIGVRSSWLTLAAKSRRTASSRRRSEMSSTKAMVPSGISAVPRGTAVMSRVRGGGPCSSSVWVAARPSWAVATSCSTARRHQGRDVAVGVELGVLAVAQDELAAGVVDHDGRGEGVERPPEPHRLGQGVGGRLLGVAERPVGLVAPVPAQRGAHGHGSSARGRGPDVRDGARPSANGAVNARRTGGEIKAILLSRGYRSGTGRARVSGRARNHNFLSSPGRQVPIPSTGVAYMIKKRFDFWMALCVLVGVVMVLLAGFHRLGIDLELPLP